MKKILLSIALLTTGICMGSDWRNMSDEEYDAILTRHKWGDHGGDTCDIVHELMRTHGTVSKETASIGLDGLKLDEETTTTTTTPSTRTGGPFPIMKKAEVLKVLASQAPVTAPSTASEITVVPSYNSKEWAEKNLEWMAQYMPNKEIEDAVNKLFQKWPKSTGILGLDHSAPKTDDALSLAEEYLHASVRENLEKSTNGSGSSFTSLSWDDEHDSHESHVESDGILVILHE